MAPSSLPYSHTLTHSHTQLVWNITIATGNTPDSESRATFYFTIATPTDFFFVLRRMSFKLLSGSGGGGTPIAGPGI